MLLENPIDLLQERCRTPGVAVTCTAPRPVIRKHTQVNFPARWALQTSGTISEGLVSFPNIQCAIWGVGFILNLPWQFLHPGKAELGSMLPGDERIPFSEKREKHHGIQNQTGFLTARALRRGLENRCFPIRFSHGCPSSQRYFLDSFRDIALWRSFHLVLSF